ncbi:uncharacterized protein LOC124365343 [Homalodisca vitripennis]|uniref:uncharacterized protein LOC124365343 n=1 Tax=Homalodisca vitripennis TaxID=197043 RepID=UPI001EEC9257|nr:uncharacterized protein LOC124365343 [Homalodisca vitripennis]
MDRKREHGEVDFYLNPAYLTEARLLSASTLTDMGKDPESGNASTGIRYGQPPSQCLRDDRRGCLMIRGRRRRCCTIWRPSSHVRWALMLVSTLTHASVATLAHHAAPIEVPGLEPALRHIAGKAELLSRAPISDMRRYEELAMELAWAECVVAQVASLEHKLCPGAGQTQEMRKFLAALVTQPEALVPGGPRGDIASRIRAMFSEAHKASQMISDNDPSSHITTETVESHLVFGIPSSFGARVYSQSVGSSACSDFPHHPTPSFCPLAQR